MAVEEEVGQLRAENQTLREALRQTQEQLCVALARIEELEKQKLPPPAFVKANVTKTQEKKQRKKRKYEENRVCSFIPAFSRSPVEHYAGSCA